MQVIAGFFGSGALAELPVHGAAFSHYVKQLAQFAKLATSYMLLRTSATMGFVANLHFKPFADDLPS